MWIIDNSDPVIDMINDFNTDNQIKSVNTYDFTTLYDCVPHDDLKIEMKWISDIAFRHDPHKKIFINKNVASWRRPSK